jgi:hypothetical protein
MFECHVVHSGAGLTPVMLCCAVLLCHAAAAVVVQAPSPTSPQVQTLLPTMPSC